MWNGVQRESILIMLNAVTSTNAVHLDQHRWTRRRNEDPLQAPSLLLVHTCWTASSLLRPYVRPAQSSRVHYVWTVGEGVHSTTPP